MDELMANPGSGMAVFLSRLKSLVRPAGIEIAAPGLEALEKNRNASTDQDGQG
jgi:hypothetical protein